MAEQEPVCGCICQPVYSGHTSAPLYGLWFFPGWAGCFYGSYLLRHPVVDNSTFYALPACGGALLAHLGAWRWVGVAGFVAAIILVGRLVARTQKHKI